MRTVLTIAGSDSSGGAGIQADLRTFAALGVYGTTAITAITAQNRKGISAIEPLPADLVTAQIEAVAGDLEIHATKIGMLATSAIVEAVAAAIEELELPLVVLDPVLSSTSGHRLLDMDGVQMLITELLPRVRVVTPNVPEAEALSGRRISSADGMRDAARRLHDMGAGAVIIKGGHGPLRQVRGRTTVIDLLFDGQSFHESRVPRVGRLQDDKAGVGGPPPRGTGCAFASAVSAYLALGHDLPDAAARAQRHVAGLIARTATPTYTER
jgi:hydroxymethylpyrimidine/phosphomethylpyrimidine kinase